MALILHGKTLYGVLAKDTEIEVAPEGSSATPSQAWGPAYPGTGKRGFPTGSVWCRAALVGRLSRGRWGTVAQHGEIPPCSKVALSLAAEQWGECKPEWLPGVRPNISSFRVWTPVMDDGRSLWERMGKDNL